MDLTNKRIGKLFVKNKSESKMVGDRLRPFWNVECDCGFSFDSAQSGLSRGIRLDKNMMCRFCSAKIANKEAMKKVVTHGMSKGNRHPLYNKYYDIKSRLRRDKNYTHISMCEEWDTSIENFISWSLRHGWKEGLEIDRYPDRNGDYEPSNCRYVDKFIQAQNKNHYKQEGEPNIKKQCNKYVLNVQFNKVRTRESFDNLEDAIAKRIEIKGY